MQEHLTEDYSVSAEDKMEKFKELTLNSRIKKLFTIVQGESKSTMHRLTPYAYTVFKRKRWTVFLSGNKFVFKDEVPAKVACLMHALDKGGAKAGKLRELVRCWFTETLGG